MEVINGRDRATLNFFFLKLFSLFLKLPKIKKISSNIRKILWKISPTFRNLYFILKSLNWNQDNKKNFKNLLSLIHNCQDYKFNSY